MHPRLKHFGWGREGEGLTLAEEAFVLGRVEQRFGPAERIVQPPRLEDIKLAPPRLDPSPSLPFCSTALYDRAAHTYGKSFPDYVRGLVGDYSNAPDVVAYPSNEEEVAAVLDWAGEAQASATPFGGGSSVVGGVEPHRDATRYKGAVTIDLRELGRVLEVDKTSRAARIEAGAFGPAPSMLANLPHRESQRDSNTIVLVLSGLGALRARARCNRIVLCREGQKNAGSRNLPIPEPASAWQVIFASVAALPHWVLNAKDEDT